MKRVFPVLPCLAALAIASAAAPSSVRADTISYVPGVPGTFGSLTSTLQTLGYNTSLPGLETGAQSFTVPGAAGTTTRLDFTFVQEIGGYDFSFGFFDTAAVTANPLIDRQAWGVRALNAATEIFDERNIQIGDTASFEIAAGTRLGWYLIPDDTLADVLADPGSFFAVGGRPDPLFSVADANPGAYDQMLSFFSGGLHTFAFEDLSRTGYSDQDFNDLVITMRTPVLSDQSVETAAVPEPPLTALLLILSAGVIAAGRSRARA